MVMKKLIVSLPTAEDPTWTIAVLHDIGRRHKGQYGLCRRPQAIEFVHEHPEAIEHARRRLKIERLAEEELLAASH